MKTFQFFLFAILGLLLGLTIALPQPHEGMVNTAALRDVGVIYGEPDFKGPGKFIFEIKAAPECLPLNTGVVSIKICKSDVACTFYTGGGCTPGPKNFAVSIGCGDVKEVKTPLGSFFTNYACGHADVKPPANMTLEAEPHDPRNDGATMLV